MRSSNLLEETKLILRQQGIKLRSELGQNFLVNESVIRRQIEYAELSTNDEVLEVGAGIGTLTKFLLQRTKKVYAVELDSRLIQILKERFSSAKNLEIIHGDAVKIPLPSFDKVVANIPYEISSPLTFRLLEHGFKKAVLTYQREFAERLIARHGEKNYSRLSVAAYYYTTARIREVLLPSAFYPQPKVSSAIVELVPRQPPFRVDEKKYFNLVAGVFMHKRKTLRNALLDSFNSIFEISADKQKQRRSIESSLPGELLQERVFRLSPEQLASVDKALENAGVRVRS